MKKSSTPTPHINYTRRQNLDHRLCQEWMRVNRPDVYAEIRAEVDRQIPVLTGPRIKSVLPDYLREMK